VLLIIDKLSFLSKTADWTLPFLIGNGGMEMKKVILVIGIVVLLLVVLRSKALQGHADKFIKSYQSHEQKQIHDFLSQ